MLIPWSIYSLQNTPPAIGTCIWSTEQGGYSDDSHSLRSKAIELLGFLEAMPNVQSFSKPHNPLESITEWLALHRQSITASGMSWFRCSRVAPLSTRADPMEKPPFMSPSAFEKNISHNYLCRRALTSTLKTQGLAPHCTSPSITKTPLPDVCSCKLA